MKKLPIFLSTFLFLLFSFSSCKKQVQQVQENKIKNTRSGPFQGVPDCDIQIVNGYLVFASTNDVNNYFHHLESLTESNIDYLEILNSFTSYDRNLENILIQYMNLNEDSTTTMNQILSFRSQYAQYITITDEDYEPTIEGIFNRLVNKDGFLQIGNNVMRFVNNKIYTTDPSHIELLQNEDYTNSLVTVTTIKKTRQVN